MALGSDLTGVASTAREDDLADVDTGDKAVGLAESTTHTGLKSIGTSARQHLVDTDDVVGVGADAEVETFLTGGLHHVPFECVSMGVDVLLLDSSVNTHLLAQIRAASRASEETCSYSLETR